jgi:hypothetical protein
VSCVATPALLAALDEAGSEVDQALALLAAAGVQDPERLPLGEGDRLLLALCVRATGEPVEIVAECPRCGELSQAALGPAAVPAPSPRVALLGPGGGLREPTYGDLRELDEDPDEALRTLLARCVIGSPSRAPVAADLALVDDSLAGPLTIACAECGAPVAVDVDVQSAVLARIARRARDVDYEVHLLAGAYGWSLGEIESLGEVRRGALAALVEETR